VPKSPTLNAAYIDVRSGMFELLHATREVTARNVNALMTASYWEIGRRIVEAEQKGKRRAGYSEQLIERLSADLTQQFGRDFSPDNLENMCRFFFAYPALVISETKSRISSNESVSANGTLTIENPSVSLMLCADKDHALARYALDGLPNKIMAANYKTVLPDAELLQKELEKTRLLLEASSRVNKKMNKDVP
jgi:hypothetical protein